MVKSSGYSYVQVYDSSLTVKGDGNITTTGYSDNGSLFVLYGNDTATGTTFSELTIDNNVNITTQGYGILACSPNYANDCVVNIKGGSITAGNAALGINGNVQPSSNTVVNISGGTLTGETAIYAAGYATWNITGGTLTGKTGIYAKSGQLNISAGATVIGNGEAANFTHNGNGYNPTGAAIVVENAAGYSPNLDVNITGGTFESTQTSEAVQSFDYSSGTDTREAVSNFVSGGTFIAANNVADELPAEYLAEGATQTNGTVTQTYVAKVGNDYYATIEDAIAAARTGSTKTVTCLDDFELIYPYWNQEGSMHYIDITGVTLDLNGHEMTIGSRWSTLFTGTNGKIMNGTCTGTDCTKWTNYNYGLYIWGTGSGDVHSSGSQKASIALENLTCNYGVHFWNADATITNCDVTGSASYYAVWADECSNVTIESGNFTTGGAAVLGAAKSSDGDGSISVEGGNYTVPSGKSLVLAASSSSKPENVKFSGGTANVLIPEANWADGYVGTTEPDEDGKYTVETVKVAEVNGVKYETLEAAIAAAQSGDTITLLANTTVNSTIVVNDGKKFTINTNGKEISSGVRVFEIRHGGVTLTGNGTVSTTAVSAVAVYGSTNSTDADYATFTLGAGTTISAPSGYGAMIGANSKAAYGAKLTLNGTINSLYGVYVNGNIQEPADKTNAAQVTINGTVTAGNENAAVYAAGYAKWAVNAGSTVSGGSGIYIKSGDLAVNGGTITATGAKTAYTFNTNGANGTGDAIIIDSCGYPGNVPTVAINAGRVTSANGAAVASYTKQDDPLYPDATFARVDEVIPATSKAVFSSDVSKLAEEGYVTVYDNNDEGYVVAKDTSDSISITTADEIDVNLYFGETGEEATVEYTFNTTPNIQENTQRTKVVDFDSLPVVDGKRKLTIRVAPAQIRDNIDIFVKDANGDVLRPYEDYSVARYCDELVDGDYSENIKTLAKSVLDYGKAAANFFGYNEYAFTNQAVNFNDFTFDTTGWTAVANNISIDEVRYVATSVPSLRFKVDMSEAEAERYTVETDKGYKAKFVKVGDDVILQVTGIPASKLGETITVSVKDAQEDEIATIQYTPIIYAYNAAKSNNVELARLGKTIGQYSAAAKAVFA
ncbi:MAG: hypothetical protein E7520_05650 [Ruminococcaceae bacterium]|nr:hypothetical protein [Oscillospiraceae bacterium]